MSNPDHEYTFCGSCGRICEAPETGNPYFDALCCVCFGAALAFYCQNCKREQMNLENIRSILPGLQWSRRLYELRNREGNFLAVVEGLSMNGLVIHEDEDFELGIPLKTWRVTHAESGAVIFAQIPTEELNRHISYLFNTGIDWKKSPNDLLFHFYKQMKSVGDYQKAQELEPPEHIEGSKENAKV